MLSADRIFSGIGNMTLTYHCVKGGGTVFTGGDNEGIHTLQM